MKGFWCAGAAEARADQEAIGEVSTLAGSMPLSADAAALLLEPVLARLPGLDSAEPATSYPNPAPEDAPGGAAAAAAEEVRPAAGGGCAGPNPDPGSKGAWAAPAAAAHCEAAWAAAGGGAAAGRLARAERLHAAARMAWLERLREDSGA